MPKTTNAFDDDEIIAQGLAHIREGLISGKWSYVAQGYNMISGEDLPSPEVEKPKSRLEKIREKIKESAEEPVEETPDFSKWTNKQLTDHLLKSGFKAKDLKNKNKATLLKLVRGPDDAPEETPKEKPQLNEDYLMVQKIKGGTRFGNKGEGVIEIFSDPPNPQDAEKNKKVYRPRLPVKERVTRPREITDENAPFRYSDKNRRPE